MNEPTGAKPNIYLIGLSGTGKTRSGRRVAEFLGWPFVEMDGVIEDRAGKSIPRIFVENGEDFFRDLESQILAEIAARGGRVVSTGGGVPIRVENRKIMQASGLIVRLSASPELIHQRLVSSAPQRGRAIRPLLGDDAPIEKLRNMLDEREEAYAAASVTIDTERKSHDQVVEAIAEAWRSSGMAESDNR
ncbi:MAG: shikimate kinase [Dehalococcoidia bacterium]|nr:shikimate kinase [Dehalococcoidia bacterium]MDP7262456.1 shikimate kinase [Dehalococcoidia bacterium]MDP7485052.1 shikimate kinase [Dehalococcoidia bacterium]